MFLSHIVKNETNPSQLFITPKISWRVRNPVNKYVLCCFMMIYKIRRKTNSKVASQAISKQSRKSRVMFSTHGTHHCPC